MRASQMLLPLAQPFTLAGIRAGPAGGHVQRGAVCTAIFSLLIAQYSDEEGVEVIVDGNGFGMCIVGFAGVDAPRAAFHSSA